MKKVISVYWVVPALFWLEGGVEVGAGVLEQVEHQLEAFGAFVVGVGHVVVACCQCAELHHAHDFTLLLCCGSQPTQVGGVGCIHGNDDVETVEVGLAHLPCTVRQGVAPPLGMHAHALVGQFAGMVRPGTCRIDVPAGAVAGVVDNALEHAMRRRAAAYVAEAHKKDLDMRVAGKQPAQPAGVSARKIIDGCGCHMHISGGRNPLCRGSGLHYIIRELIESI